MSIRVGQLIQLKTFYDRFIWDDRERPSNWPYQDRYFLVKEVADKGTYYRVVIGDHRKELDGPIAYGVTGAIRIMKEQK